MTMSKKDFQWINILIDLALADVKYCIDRGDEHHAYTATLTLCMRAKRLNAK